MNNSEFAEYFKKRTKQIALRAIKLCKKLFKTEEGRIIGRQFLKSSTSVAANYRAVCRARSGAEFFSKLSIVVEEADESAFWLEIILESGMAKEIGEEQETENMLKEANEILAVASSARKTVRTNKGNE
ncbi:MAG: four helix bundle protein [Bacteroidetes bacterium]|nr:four helix bundle protein [Bacteroidota bacterium]